MWLGGLPASIRGTPFSKQTKMRLSKRETRHDKSSQIKKLRDKNPPASKKGWRVKKKKEIYSKKRKKQHTYWDILYGTMGVGTINKKVKKNMWRWEVKERVKFESPQFIGGGGKRRPFN